MGVFSVYFYTALQNLIGFGGCMFLWIRREIVARRAVITNELDVLGRTAGNYYKRLVIL